MSRQDGSDGLAYYTPKPPSGSPETVDADLCIYGGTPAAIAAALQAGRTGLRAVVLAFGRHLGGLTASGLGATDVGNKAAIGGISRQFYRALGTHYGAEETWTFEPHAAAQVFNDMIGQAGARVLFEQHLESVELRDGRITELRTGDGGVFRARAFLDATYEGDLVAAAGVSYAVGREANATYREARNGIHFGHPNHNFRAWVDPYVRPGKPDSGLLPGVTDAPPGVQGQASDAIQAYNFRLCLTRRADNRIPFDQPAGYDPQRYTLGARYIQAGVWDAIRLNTPMPNGKSDLNNHGAFSTDNIGMNHEWPEASYARRDGIFQEHVAYQKGLLWFLANDDRLPARVREEASQWGLPKDEFSDTGGWPHELYVREARRMVSDYLITDRDCMGLVDAPRPIALAAYQMDSHNCRRLAVNGQAVNEGNVEMKAPRPYGIDYRAVVPRGEECTNLLVPVCVSASHVAYGSVRMEPVFMVLGQSAATAAALAIEGDRPVQEVDYGELRTRLIEDGQVLCWQST